MSKEDIQLIFKNLPYPVRSAISHIVLPEDSTVIQLHDDLHKELNPNVQEDIEEEKNSSEENTPKKSVEEEEKEETKVKEDYDDFILTHHNPSDQENHHSLLSAKEILKMIQELTQCEEDITNEQRRKRKFENALEKYLSLTRLKVAAKDTLPLLRCVHFLCYLI